MTAECVALSDVEYAIEADPGRCTASYPTYDNFDDAMSAANAPVMIRDHLPPVHVLARPPGGGWRVVQRFRHGSYVRAYGGNVHIAVEFEPLRVRVACGKTWDMDVLNPASDEAAERRPCHECWGSM